MKILVKSFFKNEDGATAIEYALIATGIGLAIFGTVSLIGDELASKFTYLSENIDGE